jgi:hypothetical protein
MTMTRARFTVPVALFATCLMMATMVQAQEPTKVPAQEPVSLQAQTLQSTPAQLNEHPFLYTSGPYLCCLDDWQGSVCPQGQRLASYCSTPCEGCGSFFCYTQPPRFGACYY